MKNPLVSKQTPESDDSSVILRMVETVKPDDMEALGLIDDAVFRYVNSFYDSDGSKISSDCVRINGNTIKLIVKGVLIWETRNIYLPQYTRSRDALKSIRPKGWWFGIRQYSYKYEASAYQCTSYQNHKLIGQTKELPTEELAELHAIIQAIAYERANP